ncbi:MFS transporter [Bacillaceae bacterium SIJ1]|uniref:MFS transporter n=1 Tax=Litoribacterium kuwaitense TaxID=1398745 RepID=UPI0013EBE51C|nr:MFS transporter [Litoribacterium kuwaitense]NGP46494.1 MFS transporter [Litoribacterium kuwaitense]
MAQMETTISHASSAWTRNQKILIFSLTLLTFSLGTSEFVIVGLLPDMALSLGVSLAQAGALVSGFALAYALGTPFAIAVTSRFPRRIAMPVLIAIFILGNLLSALVSDYTFLMGTRIITALVSGVLVTLALSIGSEEAPPHKRGAAMAFIFAGFSFASVFGVPLGTFIGQLGGWPLAFWLNVVLGVIVLVLLLPQTTERPPVEQKPFFSQFALLKEPSLLVAFGIPVTAMAGTYVIYTYISPIFLEVTGIKEAYVGAVLLLYGLATIFSNLYSGRIADGRSFQALKVTFLLQALALALFYVTAPFLIVGLINLMVIGFFCYLFNGAVQLYLMQVAEKKLPHAKDLAASLLPVSANFGIAIGSAIGGLVATNIGLVHTTWVGAIFIFLSFLLTTLLLKVRI